MANRILKKQNRPTTACGAARLALRAMAYSVMANVDFDGQQSLNPEQNNRLREICRRSKDRPCVPAQVIPGAARATAVIEIFDAWAVSATPVLPCCAPLTANALAPVAGRKAKPCYPRCRHDGGSLRLAVGPAVVDEVDNLDAYRISLRGVGSCALAVKSLVYSHIAGGHAAWARQRQWSPGLSLRLWCQSRNRLWNRQSRPLPLRNRSSLRLNWKIRLK